MFERPLSYDEVDYAHAAKTGIVTNALEKGSLNMIQFVNLARVKAFGTITTENDFIHSLPPEEGSPFNLRHFHPPLPVYFWSIVLSSFSSIDEGLKLKIGNLILLAALLVSAISVILALNRKSLSLGILFLALFFSSDLVIKTYLQLNFHTFFTIGMLVFCALAIRFARSADRWSAILLGIAAGLLFVTLETAVVVCSIAFLLGIKLNVGKKVERGVILLTACSAILTFFIIWPGALKSGEPFRTWAIYVYRLFFQGNAEYQNVEVFRIWRALIVENPIMFLLIAAGGVVCLVDLKRVRRSTKFVFLLGGLYSAFITPFAMSTGYILPGIATMFVGSTMALLHLYYRTGSSKYIQYAFVGSTFVVLGLRFTATDHPAKARQALADRTVLMELIELMEDAPEKDVYYMDGGHIANYYSEELNVRKLEMCSYADPQFFERVNYRYTDRWPKIEAREYSAVIIGKERKYAPGTIQRLLNAGYMFEDKGRYHFYRLKE